MEALIDALVTGDHKRALATARALRVQGVSVEDIVRLGIQPAMEALDYKCTVEQFNLLEIMLAGRAAWALAGWQRCASRPAPGTHPARLCATWPGLQQAGQGWLPQCSGGAQEQWRGFRGQRYTPPVCSSCCWLRLKVWMLTDSTDHPLMMSPLAGWYSCVPMAAADGRAYWQRVGEPCGA